MSIISPFTPRRNGFLKFRLNTLGDTLWVAAGTVPSLDVRFGQGSLVDVISGNSASIVRATSSDYVDAAGDTQTAGPNVARFQHEGGVLLGLFVEPSIPETLILPFGLDPNLDTYSEGYDYQGGYLLTRLAQFGGTAKREADYSYTFTVLMPAATEFNLRTTGTVNYRVDWGDGVIEDSVTENVKPHTYADAGTYTVRVVTDKTFSLYANDISPDDTRITAVIGDGSRLSWSTNFSRAWYGCSSLTSFPLIDTSSGTSFDLTWYDCSSLTSFPLIDTSSGTSFIYTWRDCSSLTSFPLIDTSSGTSFARTWHGCSSLTSFPLIDTSSGTNFDYTWFSCSSLTSFPLLDTSSGTSFNLTWYDCSSLTSFPLIDTSSVTSFNQVWHSCSSLTSFPLIDTSSGTSFDLTWRDCSSLTSFPLIVTSSGITFSLTWYGCSSLTSFPLIDTSSGITFTLTWRDCSSLTSFPLIDTSSGTSFDYTWFRCSSLTSFPLIDTSSGTNFTYTWYGCSSLTSFPLIDTSSGITFNLTWYDCSSLTSFPANMFDGCTATAFNASWQNCALDVTSVNNILISIESNGTSNGTLDIDGGTSAAPTGAGATAKADLIARGWTVNTN